MGIPFIIVHPDGLTPMETGMKLELRFRDGKWHQVRVETLIRGDDYGLTVFWREGRDTGSIILRNGLSLEYQGVRLPQDKSDR